MRLLVVLIAFITGCSSSSGVLKTGPDTFAVSVGAAPARGGMPTARKIAHEEANEACRKSGKELRVLDENMQTVTPYGAGTIDLSFRCM